MICARCERDRPIHCRGLCRSCYTTARKQGVLEDYPRRYHRFMEDYDELEFIGVPPDERPARLGITARSVARQLARHRQPVPRSIRQLAEAEKRGH